ncbi:MAG: HD domain-containing phosphohydrolase [Alphaproteobacteria bacterium]|nr:HD domain-containing phosphohydrolase [Alphaproteobacteria bacterium]
MTDSTSDQEQVGTRTRFIIAGLGVGLVVAVLLGIWLVVAFVDRESQRDIRQWQLRLGIVADSRTVEVNRWLESQFLTMQSLAENASLQLYMTQISLDDGNRNDDLPETDYLRNLLNATAARDGFLPLRAEPTLNANVAPTGRAGIGLANASGDLLVATDAMPALTSRLKLALQRASEGEPTLVDIFEGAGGSPTIGFVVPVYGIQDDARGSNNIGFVIGLRQVGDDLFKLLLQPGETAKTAESYLVRKAGATVEYLTPLADGTKSLKRRLAVDTEDLAASFVLEKPGGFATLRDYRGNEVFATGRAISATPWFLIRKVDLAEALAESNRRRTTLLTTFILVIVGIAVTIVAVWRHGTSVRAAQAAANFRIANERMDNFSRFLRVVTDGQPNAVSAVTGDGHYTFANAKATEGTGVDQDEILGKTMANVIGPVQAKIFQQINTGVMRTLEAEKRTHTFEEDDGSRAVVMSDHIPLQGDRDHPPGVLMILQDITEVVSEREERERIMRALVTTLVGLVDRRDPYSANQTQRVAEVSAAISDEMDEPEETRRTVDIAGNLMNLGKILVPPEVLTKTGALSDEEAELIRSSLLATADIVDAVNFNLPVGDTLRHLQERWDGTGYPDGLSEQDIGMGARIIAVANAFVGMVSPRAYRGALSFDEVSNILMGDAGTRYDPRPVAALINIINNRGGRETWEHYRTGPDAADETAS